MSIDVTRIVPAVNEAKDRIKEKATNIAEEAMLEEYQTQTNMAPGLGGDGSNLAENVASILKIKRVKGDTGIKLKMFLDGNAGTPPGKTAAIAMGKEHGFTQRAGKGPWAEPTWHHGDGQRMSNWIPIGVASDTRGRTAEEYGKELEFVPTSTCGFLITPGSRRKTQEQKEQGKRAEWDVKFLMYRTKKHKAQPWIPETADIEIAVENGLRNRLNELHIAKRTYNPDEN